MVEANNQELVKYHRERHLGIITLNRPEKRNALSWALWLSLEEAIRAAEADKEARVVLLQGQGKTFCAGLDLGPENELLQAIGATPSATQKMDFFRLVRRGQDIFTRLERLPQPTIAVIQGHCLGAGLEMVLCCDLRFCSAETHSVCRSRPWPLLPMPAVCSDCPGWWAGVTPGRSPFADTVSMPSEPGP